MLEVTPFLILIIMNIADIANLCAGYRTIGNHSWTTTVFEDQEISLHFDQLDNISQCKFHNVTAKVSFEQVLHGAVCRVVASFFISTYEDEDGVKRNIISVGVTTAPLGGGVGDAVSHFTGEDITKLAKMVDVFNQA